MGGGARGVGREVWKRARGKRGRWRGAGQVEVEGSRASGGGGEQGKWSGGEQGKWRRGEGKGRGKGRGGYMEIGRAHV